MRHYQIIIVSMAKISGPAFRAKSFARVITASVMACVCAFSRFGAASADAAGRTFDAFEAYPPIYASAESSAEPLGLTPQQVKAVYNLPSTGGSGTIAVIDAYDSPGIEGDLAAFDKKFSLQACTIANKCLEVHPMGASSRKDAGWAMETALDVEWAHAIAPKAKILLIESTGGSGSALMRAVDYARERQDVIAVSMSWGGPEFDGEAELDSHFKADHPVVFTASSGDDGAGASWPAVSPAVIAVGGTSLSLDPKGKLISEKAWSGSGGGVSGQEAEPAFQAGYSIPRAAGKRAVPDVAYAADPAHGFSVYHDKGWSVVGGTSAGAPQWAAIASLAAQKKDPVSLPKLYADKAGASYTKFFRDITSGKNGDCAYYCAARKHYDYITGLGSPVTYRF